MAPKAIPDRWIPYEACGKVIEGTRFICFKVPLKRSVQVNVPGINKIWDIPTVLKEIPKLGAVIDLTNTGRYYNPQDFVAANVKHRKILMPGRVIPGGRTVKEFMDAADEFLEHDNDSLVGVHCTHGLNRTGYMVCRYMRDKLGIPGAEAIQRFETARGYEIERNIYIDDILGKVDKTAKVGREVEIVPVNRRHDMTYRSPLDNQDIEDDQKTDRYKRFGTVRSNSNRIGNSGSGNSSNQRRSTGFFSCYTDRYTARNDGPNVRRDSRSKPSSSSWRNADESRTYSGDKRKDRFGILMPKFQRNDY